MDKNKDKSLCLGYGLDMARWIAEAKIDREELSFERIRLGFGLESEMYPSRDFQ